MIARILLHLQVLALILVVVLFSNGCETLENAEDSSSGMVDSEKLEEAIELAGGYIRKYCDENGKFRYRLNMNPQIVLRPQYNLLRHAGTMYAVSMLQQQYPNRANLECLKRTTAFLKQSIGPVPEGENLATVWSTAKNSIPANPKLESKLGGAGLALVSLTSYDRESPGVVPLAMLEQIGNFIIFMQKKSGDFYSKYNLSKSRRSDKWRSLFYPGEAAFGLVLLYKQSRSKKYLDAAVKSLVYLADQRVGRESCPLDHWALIATSQLLLLDDDEELPIKIPREKLVLHAEQIAESMLKSDTDHSVVDRKYGCFSSDGVTSPTATRLEGLIAIYPYMENSNLKEQLSERIPLGINFLIRSQKKIGEFAGAIPRAINLLPVDHPDKTVKFNRRATEVRIDYVQHALSAMLEYRLVFGR